jgi:serine phosphatase RsbU (regulator of sigma subunit)
MTAAEEAGSAPSMAREGAGHSVAPSAAHGIQQLAVRLSAAVSPEEVLDVVADCGGPLLGAHMVNISLLDESGENLQLVTSRRTSASVERRFASYPVDAPLPSRDALAGGRPVVIRGAEERNRRYPMLAGESSHNVVFAVLPLIDGQRALGVLALGWLNEDDFRAEQMATAEEVAAVCAAAMQRAGRYRHERQARTAAEQVTGRLRDLAALTRQLAQATEPDVVADLIVSTASRAVNADTATISSFDGAQRFTVLAARGVPPEWVSRWRTFTTDDVPLTRDLINGRAPVIVATAETVDQRDSAFLCSSGQRMWVNLPLMSATSIVGFASFGWHESHELTTDDLDVLTAMASHATSALERADLLARSQRVAEVLQRALLPQIISRLAGWEMAARYIPAVEGTQVGGDWYDAFRLSTGGVGLVLGDVAGKGIRAAAVMGAIRSAIRAFSIVDPTPSVLLSELDLYFAKFKPVGEMVTCCYAVLDPDSGRLTYASAGHPPPLVIGRGGHQWLEGATTPPLGVGASVRRDQAEAVIAAGSVLVLYSDGLVERRRHVLSDDLAALAEAAVTLPDALHLQTSLDSLVERLSHPDRTVDDLAVLALRRAVDDPA